MRPSKSFFRQFLVGLWLTFTLSLTIWWLIFGLRQLDRLKELDHGSEFSRQQRMLIWEGSILVLVVAIGGVALHSLSRREAKRREDMQNFLSGFTHELKTSLASLRLQSEILQEEEPSSPKLARLLREIVRLEIQLENALLLARTEEQNLFEEEVSLSDLIDHLAPLWPEISITAKADCKIKGDRRALESVFKNIFQNAAHHGEAKTIILSPKVIDGRINLEVRDDGHGFRGKKEFLGKAFYRHSGKSGSGLGIFLTHNLLRKMGGDLSIPSQAEKGFSLSLYLKGAA